jgi:hypothetical protein
MLSDSNFLHNIHALRSALDLPWDDCLDIFGMTPKQAEIYLRNPKALPIKYAMNFCEHFSLDLETVFSEKFDSKAFARNYLNGPPILPEHYQMEKNSKVITLINFVSALNEEGLDWLNELILRRLQVPKTILLYPELNIPCKLILDFLGLVEKYSQNLDFMKKSGEEGVIKLNKIFNFAPTNAALTSEFYDEFFSEKIKQFDQTYDYKVISHRHNKIIFKCSMKESFKEIYQLKSIYSKAFLQYKKGIASGLSTLLGHSLGETTILSSPQEESDFFQIRLPTQHCSSHKNWH